MSAAVLDAPFRDRLDAAVTALGAGNAGRDVSHRVAIIDPLGVVDQEYGALVVVVVTAGDRHELALPENLPRFSKRHRPAGDVLLVDRIGHRTVRAAGPQTECVCQRCRS